jgi:hypothetical protein
MYQAKRSEILKEKYDTVTVEYLGGRKMYKTLRQEFYYIEIKRKIERYI